VANRWLVEHQATEDEIGDLLALADRDLKDCQAQGLSADGKLRLAYNAALQAATAALAAAGYRTGRGEAHHYCVIQSIAHTIGAEAAEFARWLRRQVKDWLRAHHPALLGK